MTSCDRSRTVDDLFFCVPYNNTYNMDDVVTRLGEDYGSIFFCNVWREMEGCCWFIVRIHWYPNNELIMTLKADMFDNIGVVSVAHPVGPQRTQFYYVNMFSRRVVNY
jgi:hypothetical protein